jgi:hypothetical protein
MDLDFDGTREGAPGTRLIYDAAPARGDRNRFRIHLNRDQLELLDNNSGTVLTSQLFESTSSVVVHGSSGDDTLIVDFTDGNPIPAGGLTFSGGDQVTPEGDILEIKGGSFQWAVYDYYNAHDGRVVLDDAIIKYSGLEPLLMNAGTAANIIFNLPAGTVGASLQDDGIAGNGSVQLASTNATFETTTFTVPTISLTVNGGGGTDTITTAAGFSGDFNAKLTINGTQTTDAMTLNALTLGNAGTNPGQLIVLAKTINVSGAINTSAGTAPHVIFTAGTSIVVNSINAGASGDVSLTAGASGSNGLITSVSPNDAIPDVTGRTVTLAAGGVSNGNTGQIGFFTTSAQFFEVTATTINASTNNSRAWISCIGNTAVGSINVGSNTAFLKTIGNLTSTHSGSTPDIMAVSLNLTSIGATGSFGTSFNPLLLQTSNFRANVSGVGSINATNVPFGASMGVTLAKTANGAINLRAAGGNLTLIDPGGTATMTIAAPGNTVTLTASGAIVTSTSAGVTDVAAANLAASGGVGIGTPSALRTIVSNLSFVNSGGIVNILNSGPLTISSVGGIASSANNGTTTTLVASGGLTFASNTTSAGTFIATATESASLGDDVTVNSGVIVQSTGGNLTLNAGDNINLLTGSTAKASGTVSLNDGFNDTDGNAVATIQGTIMGASTIVTGGPGNDLLVIDFANGAFLPSFLSYDGGIGASNALTISDQGSANPHTYAFDATQIVRDGTAQISYSNTQIVRATGGNGSDFFGVTPSSATVFVITGGLPAPPVAPGDSLNVDINSTTNPSLDFASTMSGFIGRYTFGNRKPVSFEQIETFYPPPGPTTLANISTRLRVETGDNALIGGFIITGTQPKKVIALATGPSLTGLGVPGALANPTLELYQANTLLDSNDNWVDSPNKQAIINSGVAPTNDLESAIIATLPANNAQYTAVVRGVNNGTGVGTVQFYDLDRSVDSKLANISTRGLVQTGDNVLIAGTIVLGVTPQKVIVRAIGPSLPLSNSLANPTLELRDGNGALLNSNDNWKDSPDKQAIIDSTIPPTNDLESAIVATLPANGAQYTAIVRGVNNGTGIGVVEVYALP